MNFNIFNYLLTIWPYTVIPFFLGLILLYIFVPLPMYIFLNDLDKEEYKFLNWRNILLITIILVLGFLYYLSTLGTVITINLPIYKISFNFNLEYIELSCISFKSGIYFGVGLLTAPYFIKLLPVPMNNTKKIALTLLISIISYFIIFYIGKYTGI